MATLRVDRLVLRDADAKRILIDGVTCDFRTAACTLVLGANGSGKSLLIRAMLGLVKPHSGAVLFDGVPLDDADRLYRRSGVVFQHPVSQLFGETVMNDVLLSTPAPPPAPAPTPDDSQAMRPRRPAWPARLARPRAAAADGWPERERHARVIDVLEKLAIGHLADRAPEELSGGEQRLVALAGALVAEPDVLILDEPLTELDYPAVCRVIEVLRDRRDRGATVICTAHETRDLLDIADDMVILDHGRLVWSGPAQDGLVHVNAEHGLRPHGRSGTTVASASGGA